MEKVKSKERKKKKVSETLLKVITFSEWYDFLMVSTCGCVCTERVQ